MPIDPTNPVANGQAPAALPESPDGSPAARPRAFPDMAPPLRPQRRAGVPSAIVPPDLLFCTLFVACAMIGLFFLSVQLEIITWGRRGDRRVALFCIASTLAVAALVGLAYRWLRRMPGNVLLLLAIVFGLLAFFPAYVVLYAFY